MDNPKRDITAAVALLEGKYARDVLAAALLKRIRRTNSAEIPLPSRDADQKLGKELEAFLEREPRVIQF